MKSLHDKIFTEANCISADDLQGYVSHSLSDKDKYNVELHLSECELCSEAVEGYEETSIHKGSVTHLNNRLDTMLGNEEKPSKLNIWMIAASLALLISSSYFLFNYLDQTSNTEMAENLTKLEQAKAPEKEKKEAEKFAEEIGTTINQNKEEENEPELAIAKNENTSPIPTKINELDMVEEISISETVVEETEVAEMYNADSEIIEEDEESFAISEIMVEADHVAGMASDDNVVQSMSSTPENNQRSSERTTIKEKKLSNSYPQSRVAEEEKALKQDSDEPMVASNSNPINTYELYGFVVLDYSDVHGNASADENPDVLAKKAVSEISTPAAFESNDKANGVLSDEITYNVSYNTFLDKAMKNFKNAAYPLALADFKLILNKYPQDENALFYSGLAQYNIARFKEAEANFKAVCAIPNSFFNEESKWYLALSYINLNKLNKAKLILNEIITINGFYIEKAKEELLKLK